MKKNIIIIILICIVAVLVFFLWKANAHKAGPEKSNIQMKDTISSSVANPYENALITTSIISSEDSTFGYDIIINGQILVHQPSIPGLPGNKGFEIKEHAQRVADFAANKVRNNEMPPTVTSEELKILLK